MGERRPHASRRAVFATSCCSISPTITRPRRGWRSRGPTAAVSRLDDVAGLAVMRIVSALANEAADAVVQHVAAAEAIDLAMKNGVNYPRGPLAWGDAIGAATVRDVLAHLIEQYGEDRYRI